MTGGLDLLGRGGASAFVGSKYYEEATAGDGAKIKSGSRVVFQRGRRGPFAYGAPDPPEGAAGAVSHGRSAHEFRGEIWVPVEFPGVGEIDVRAQELRSAGVVPEPARPALRPTPGPASSTKPPTSPTRSVAAAASPPPPSPAASAASLWEMAAWDFLAAADGLVVAVTVTEVAR